MKRLLALTLVLSMILSLVPAALAAQTQTEAAVFDSGLTQISGEDIAQDALGNAGAAVHHAQPEVVSVSGKGGFNGSAFLGELDGI